MFKVIYIYLQSVMKVITCEAEITEDNLVALKNIPNNKTPGNDSQSKEFYETLWEGIKEDVYKEDFIRKMFS